MTHLSLCCFSAGFDLESDCLDLNPSWILKLTVIYPRQLVYFTSCLTCVSHFIWKIEIINIKLIRLLYTSNSYTTFITINAQQILSIIVIVFVIYWLRLFLASLGKCYHLKNEYSQIPELLLIFSKIPLISGQFIFLSGFISRNTIYCK